jgi:hypothetical protein
LHPRNRAPIFVGNAMRREQSEPSKRSWPQWQA